MKNETSAEIRARIAGMHLKQPHLWGLFDLHRAAAAKLEIRHRAFTAAAGQVYPEGPGETSMGRLYQAAMQNFNRGDLEMLKFAIAACESDPHWQEAVDYMSPAYADLAAALEREEAEKAELEREALRLGAEHQAELARAEAALAAAREKEFEKPTKLREKLAGLAERIAALGT